MHLICSVCLWATPIKIIYLCLDLVDIIITTTIMYRLAACTEGHVVVVSVLIKAGVDPNQRTTLHQTGLHLAAERGNQDMIATLQAHKAHPNMKDKAGQTALYLATRHNHSDAISQLLLGQADPDLQDRDGYTPLHVAAVRGHVAALVLLLAARADANIRNKRGATPLLLACSENQADIPPLLTESTNIDLNSCDKTGSSALIIASKKGFVDLVLILLDIGVDPNIQDHDNQTALCWASRQEHKYLMDVLMDT
jgi:ankyrin repeat protein